MTDEAFNRYVRHGAAPSVVSKDQPFVQIRGDDTATTERGGRCIAIVNPHIGTTRALRIGYADPVRESRELARQLLLAADELERRRFE